MRTTYTFDAHTVHTGCARNAFPRVGFRRCRSAGVRNPERTAAVGPLVPTAGGTAGAAHVGQTPAHAGSACAVPPRDPRAVPGRCRHACRTGRAWRMRLTGTRLRPCSPCMRVYGLRIPHTRETGTTGPLAGGVAVGAAVAGGVSASMGAVGGRTRGTECSQTTRRPVPTAHAGTGSGHPPSEGATGRGERRVPGWGPAGRSAPGTLDTPRVAIKCNVHPRGWTVDPGGMHTRCVVGLRRSRQTPPSISATACKERCGVRLALGDAVPGEHPTGAA